MEILNIYMKSAHDESDNVRIIRLTNSFEAAIKQEPIEKIDVRPTTATSLDCSECGVVFLTVQEKIIHNEKQHTSPESQMINRTMSCQFCDKAYQSKKELCSHILSSNKEAFTEENTGDSSKNKEDSEVGPEVVIIEQGQAGNHFATYIHVCTSLISFPMQRGPHLNPLIK